ncbi:MAG TPA: inositol monophosphatase family protein [Polyangiaceae bacterium]|nr:inositol monophosphatase family protein [Polyangiaceae bacterium]
MKSPVVVSMVEAARAAAGVLLGYFRNPAELRVEEKGRSDLVSQADREAEAAIFEVLRRADPGARFEGEETLVGRETSGRRYVIDPLDGTANFLHGIPHFCVSIAHVDHTEVTAGVVLDPVRDELFWVERGRGAYLGERRLAVSVRPLPEALVHTGITPSSPRQRFLAQLDRLMAEVSFMRRMGSAALDLAYVAAGRGDAFFEAGLKPWDIAAGLLLVREAGGIVTDLTGGDTMLTTGNILAATRTVHAPLLAALRAD